jgi:hypothetical protein
MVMGIARGIADDYARDETYAGIAHELAVLGQVPEALRAARAIESEGYSDWHRSKVLSGALRALPPSVLPRAAERFLCGISDSSFHRESLGWLASRLPEKYLTRAFHAWLESGSDVEEDTAMLWLARAARGKPGEPEIRQAIEKRLFLFPNAKESSRMASVENATRIVTLWGERALAKRLIADGNADDDEYGPCALSRVALAFLDAGWHAEARRAANMSAARARKMGDGWVVGPADVNVRLAQVMHRLGEPERALTHARTALAVLARTSGSSSSAFDEPAVILESIGADLGAMLPPLDALQTILDALLPKPESAGHASPALLGLFTTVLARQGKRNASELAAAIESSPAGCSIWLRVRFAARWHTAGASTKARTDLSASLDQAARATPHDVLDVIQNGAALLGDLDDGRTLLRIDAALRELQTWGAARTSGRSTPKGDGRKTPPY